MLYQDIALTFTPIFKTFLSVFDLNSADIGKSLLRLVQRFNALGIYEVLEYEATLELKDPIGQVAAHHKRQKVRFLQDNIIAYQDQAWGDGNIFAEYKCSPGQAVDYYREGHRYRILISLRETKQRNDITEFNIERTITEGFTQKIEELQTEIDHLTRFVAINVIFPADRPPQSVILIEQNTSRSQVLSTECFQVLPDGRHHVRWEKKKPRLFEAYILRWKW